MSNINLVAEFSGGRLKILKQDVGIVYNAVIDKNTKKDIKRLVSEQQQKNIAVVAAPGATEARTANEKAILYDLGFSDLVYVQPTAALLASFGYQFNENVPVLVAVIGEESTDVAIILNEQFLYSGIIDVGVNACLEAISNEIIEKYKVDANEAFSMARDIFDEIVSLLPNDRRFAKFDDFIIKAERVRVLIYPFYEKIFGAINHLLSEASVDIIRQINNAGVVYGGVGAGIRGLAQAGYSVIGLQSLVAEDAQNCLLDGASKLLEQPRTLLKLTDNA